MLRRLLIRLGCYGGLALPILACGGPGGATCLGWVEDDQGVRHTPESGTENREEAQRFACNGYCREADPQYDAMYRVWLDSPAGDPSVTKDQAIFRDDGLLQYVTVTCANRCLSEVAAGTRRGGVECEE
ncbi:MAG TPA: hypothetical protein DEF51_20220 [Myxococcales bacterium]|nr:hypothetical protein [Myxococcales bacterium]